MDKYLNGHLSGLLTDSIGVMSMYQGYEYVSGL
jgi:hypothetical protein